MIKAEAEMRGINISKRDEKSHCFSICITNETITPPTKDVKTYNTQKITIKTTNMLNTIR